MNVDFDNQDIIIELPPEGKDGRSVHPAGEWSADAEYHSLDIVSYQGSSYMATRIVPAGTLPTDAEYWQVVAEKGEPGASEWGEIAGSIADQTDLQDALDSKADADDVYTKAQADTLLDAKADSADVYTKTETDTILLDKAPVILSSASGSIASFSDGFPAPVTALSVGIEPVQAGTGDPSPENIRPISGHTSAVVTRTGKNLWDVGIMTESTTWQKVTLTLPEGTYTMSSNIASDSPLVTHFRKSSSSSVDGSNKVYNGHPITITITEGEAVQVVYRRASGTDLFSSYQYQLELSSTASSYEPYQAQQVTIDLDGTRYGGVLDVLTGTMTVDRAIVDMGTLTWKYYTGEAVPNFYADISNGRSCKVIGEPYKLTCSQYGVIPTVITGSTFATYGDSLICANHGATREFTRVLVHDSRFTVASDFKTAVTGAQLVYELATPFTVQLTPSQMQTLLGQNHIWADTGDVAVEYRADTKLYIDGKFIQLQALILEN